MDYNSISAEDFGRTLESMGLNLLVRSVSNMTGFLGDVFGIQAHRESTDFAIMAYGRQIFQLHADHTYHSHPLPSQIPESGPRGGGIEIRLYETDPDSAAKKAATHGHDSVLLEAPCNKPHGLRECVILCENGYAWVPSRRLGDEEIEAVNDVT